MAALFTEATRQSIYLLEIEAQPPSAAETTGRSDFGDLAWAEEEEPDTIGQNVTTLRFASRKYNSLPSDTPANQPWDQRLKEPLTLSRQVPLVPGEGGIVELDLGEIVLLNRDGALDTQVRTYAVDGRPVVIKRVEPDAAYSTAVTIFTGTALGWVLADKSRAVLSVRGKSHRLNAPMQASLYGGTGGADGNADLANVPRPRCYGYCSNVPAVLVSAFDLLFQVNSAAVNAIPAVYDGAVPLTPGDDYPTVADLLAAVTAAGEYDTCLAEGYFQLGSNPIYQVTADVEGDKTGGVFVYKMADIGKRMLLDAGIDGSEIDGDSVTALAALQPAPMGYWLADPAAAAEAIAEFLAGGGGVLGETAEGQFFLFRLDAPTTATDTVGRAGFLDLGLIAPPEEVLPCVWRMGVEYARNWTVQQIAIDAVNITDERREFVAVEARVAVAFDTDRKAIYQRAQDFVGVLPPVRGFFRDKADAEAEAARLLAFWAPERQLLSMPVKATGLERDIGDQMMLQSNRFGLEAGVACRVFGSTFDAARNRLTLLLLR